ncbi:hypothetical protein [Caulifigura coniformis]|uniref:hypothetical protein n=1 Tax=Caulifigura coniformis TaxID=2527983 RepID=UPI0011A55176|nr:hypothetical protein [Caulifigura coniformis]
MKAQKDAGLLKAGGDRPTKEEIRRVAGKPIEKQITLADAGIDKNLADRARTQIRFEFTPGVGQRARGRL